MYVGISFSNRHDVLCVNVLGDYRTRISIYDSILRVTVWRCVTMVSLWECRVKGQWSHLLWCKISVYHFVLDIYRSWNHGTGHMGHLDNCTNLPLPVGVNVVTSVGACTFNTVRNTNILWMTDTGIMWNYYGLHYLYKGWSLPYALYLDLRPGSRGGHWVAEVFHTWSQR